MRRYRAFRVASLLAASLMLAACWPHHTVAHTVPTVITVRFTPAGAILWNGVQVDDATLDGLLKQASEQKPEPEIHLRPDKMANYEAVVRFLTAAQRRGATHIGFTGIETRDP